MKAEIEFREGFLRCFFQLRFGVVLEAFPGGSKFEKSIKTMGFSVVFVNFCKINIFKKLKNIYEIWI